MKDYLFTYIFDQLSLDDRCFRYWNRYLIALADSTDGVLLLESAGLNSFRHSWEDREFSVKGLRISKRFIDDKPVFERYMDWISSFSSFLSTIDYDIEEIQLLCIFPESFLP